MVYTFIRHAKTAGIQYRFSIQNNSIVQRTAFYQSDWLQIVDLIFFAESPAWRNFRGKDFFGYVFIKILMSDNLGRELYIKANVQSLCRQQRYVCAFAIFKPDLAGNFQNTARGILNSQFRRLQNTQKSAAAAVKNRNLGIINLNQRIIYAEDIKDRHYMFYRTDDILRRGT